MSCFPLGSLPFVKPVLSCNFVFPGEVTDHATALHVVQFLFFTFV